MSLWTAGEGSARVGLTVSSYLVAPGEPAAVLALLDPESELVDGLRETGTAVVQLLEWQHRDLADAFGGMAPAPGGMFKMAEWEQTTWGPRLHGAPTWAGVRLAQAEPRMVGWSLLVETTVEHIDIEPEEQPLVHRRGRYQRPVN